MPTDQRFRVISAFFSAADPEKMDKNAKLRATIEVFWEHTLGKEMF